MGIKRDQSLSTVPGLQRGLLREGLTETPTSSIWGVAARGCPGGRLPVSRATEEAAGDRQPFRRHYRPLF